MCARGRKLDFLHRYQRQQQQDRCCSTIMSPVQQLRYFCHFVPVRQQTWMPSAVLLWSLQVSCRLAEHVGWSEVPDQA